MIPHTTLSPDRRRVDVDDSLRQMHTNCWSLFWTPCNTNKLRNDYPAFWKVDNLNISQNKNETGLIVCALHDIEYVPKIPN